jgi:hypothetical protein
MYSSNRKRLLVLYDEACVQFVDRDLMLNKIAEGQDPHGDYVKFYNMMLDPDIMEQEFFERFWGERHNLEKYATISDKFLETFVRIMMENLTCKTRENIV